MRIGELAERAGTTARALRHYEERGLLAARRQPNGYREYDEDDVRLVREIRSLLDSGFDLDEIRPFVDCLRTGVEARRDCPGAVERYRDKLAELDAYLARLGALRERVAGELIRLAATPGASAGPSTNTDSTEEVEAPACWTTARPAPVPWPRPTPSPTLPS